jgi:hypothetical protein
LTQICRSRLRQRGHEVADVRELGMGMANDAVIAAYARENGFCLITRDKDFGDVRNYSPADYAGIIVLDLPDETIAASVLNRQFPLAGGMAEAITGPTCDCRASTRAISSGVNQPHRPTMRRRSSKTFSPGIGFTRPERTSSLRRIACAAQSF